MKVLAWNLKNLKEIADYLLKGHVVVLPTDTLYGLVASVRDENAINTVYRLKARNRDKKCIVLISSVEDLKEFDIEITSRLQKELSKYWPGRVSIELKCDTAKMEYLRRGTNTLSFRLPDDILLCKLLKSTGPLIAPSANTEGLFPAVNVEMAQKYFPEPEVLFVDGGIKDSAPSTIISLVEEEVHIIRGALP